MYSIRVEGDTRRLLKKLRSYAEIDKRRINAALAEGVRESMFERSKRSHSPEGKRWKTSIRAANEGGKTLIDTSQFRNSIRSSPDDSGFTIGTNVKHAATRQFGAQERTIRAWRAKTPRLQIGRAWVSKKKICINIPTHPFLGLSDEDTQEIKSTAEEYINREG